MSIEQTKELLNKYYLSWKEFLDWMQGQTLGLNEDGSTDIYDEDVLRYIEMKTNNTPTYFD